MKFDDLEKGAHYIIRTDTLASDEPSTVLAKLVCTTPNFQIAAFRDLRAPRRPTIKIREEELADYVVRRAFVFNDIEAGKWYGLDLQELGSLDWRDPITLKPVDGPKVARGLAQAAMIDHEQHAIRFEFEGVDPWLQICAQDIARVVRNREPMHSTREVTLEAERGSLRDWLEQSGPKWIIRNEAREVVGAVEVFDGEKERVLFKTARSEPLLEVGFSEFHDRVRPYSEPDSTPEPTRLAHKHGPDTVFEVVFEREPGIDPTLVLVGYAKSLEAGEKMRERFASRFGRSGVYLRPARGINEE